MSFHEKPWVHISQAREGEGGSELLREFVIRHRIQVLNVAGPGAYAETGVAPSVKRVLDEALAQVNLPQ